MLKGHQDILWLAGQVFLSRDFVQEIEDQGLETIFKACPYGDLTEAEKKTFETAYKEHKLRKLVEKWWKTYDEAREEGVVTKAGIYWQ